MEILVCSVFCCILQVTRAYPADHKDLLDSQVAQFHDNVAWYQSLPSIANPLSQVRLAPPRYFVLLDNSTLGTVHCGRWVSASLSAAPIHMSLLVERGKNPSGSLTHGQMWLILGSG